MSRLNPMIQGIVPRLPERGKIKIGMKGATKTSRKSGKTFQVPQRLDHFLVTTLERGSDNNFVKDETIHAIIGDKPKRIPVVLMFDDPSLNFQSRYASRKGQKIWCQGDGVSCKYLNEKGLWEFGEGRCTCGREQPGYNGPDKCKMNGTLSVIIRGAESVGGVWRFRTTGFNSTQSIPASMLLIARMSGGRLAGLPLEMVVGPKTTTDPDGNPTTIQVVSLEYSGTFEQLHKEGLRIATDNAVFHARMEQVEDHARKMLSVQADMVDDGADIAAEFYPGEPQIQDPTVEEEQPEEVEQPEQKEEPEPEAKPEKPARIDPAVSLVDIDEIF